MSKTILTFEQEKNIINQYQNGVSKHQLSQIFQVSEGTIKRALLRNGITIRQINETNIPKYSINEHFFKPINQTSDSAYICGLLASDGNISKTENTISIELKADDKEILEKINQVLNNTRPLNYRTRPNRNDSVRLFFTSKIIKEDLKNYDLIPQKTYKDCDFTRNIKPEFFPDFIRGFQDGDGCITWSNGSIRWQLDGVSLKTFKAIQSSFKEYYGIELKLREEKDPTSTLQKYRLYTYSREQCKKIFDLLYNNSTCLKMERKYNCFFSLLNE